MCLPIKRDKGVGLHPDHLDTIKGWFPVERFYQCLKANVFFSCLVVTGATDGIGKAYAEDVSFPQNFSQKMAFYVDHKCLFCEFKCLYLFFGTNWLTSWVLCLTVVPPHVQPCSPACNKLFAACTERFCHRVNQPLSRQTGWNIQGHRWVSQGQCFPSRIKWDWFQKNKKPKQVSC